MQSDGQLYKVLHKGERESMLAPPPGGPAESGGTGVVCPNSVQTLSRHSLSKTGLLSKIGRDELLLLGLIFLLVSDKNETDLPLVLALVYVLL